MGDTADKIQQAATAKNKRIIIGNDEVGGPNPPSSSKSPVALKLQGFFHIFPKKAAEGTGVGAGAKAGHVRALKK